MSKIPFSISQTRELTTDCSVGFSNYPNLFRDACVKRGFLLNILVVGKRGLGSRTLLNSLFSSPLIKEGRSNGLETYHCQIIESEIVLNITITTLHDLDEQVALSYIERKNNEYFDGEQGFKSDRKDCRIHTCLFLVGSDQIDPSEVRLMKALSKVVNLIPIISKGDSYTPDELQEKKKSLLRIINENSIDIFTPNKKHFDDDCALEVESIVSKVPLASIASEKVVEGEKCRLRVREYPWGTINIEQCEQNDFLLIRKILISSHLVDLIKKTNEVFYDKFRYRALSKSLSSEELVLAKINKIRLEIERLLQPEEEPVLALEE